MSKKYSYKFSFLSHYSKSETMRISVQKLASYVRDCLPYAGGAIKPALNRILKFLKLLISKGRFFIDSFYLFRKVAETGHSKAPQEVKLLSQLLKSTHKLGFRETLQCRKAIRLAKKGKATRPSNTKLVTKIIFSECIKQLSDKGDHVTIMGLYVMLCTGRRHRVAYLAINFLYFRGSLEKS